MQHGAKDFVRHLADAIHLQDGGGDESARFGRRKFLDQPPFPAGLADIGRDVGLRLGVDHGANVSRQRPRVAHGQRVHRAMQHGQDGGGNILLQIQTPQGRAALTGRLEGRGQNIPHHLFGQGGGINDHRVQPAGFGDQRRR